MRALWPLFARYAGAQCRGVTVLVLVTLVGVALEALLPWPLKVVVDYVLPGTPLPGALQPAWARESPAALLAVCAVAMLVLFALYQLVSLTTSVVQARVAARMQYELAGDILERLETLSLTWHGRARKGDLARRVTSDSDSVGTLLTGVAVPALAASVSLVLFFGIMWQLDRTLAVIGVFVAVPMGLIMQVFGPRMSQRAYEHSLTQGEVWAVSEQTLSALPVVQAFGAEEREQRRFRGVADRTIRAYLSNAATQLQFKIGIDGCQALGTAIVLMVGGFKVLNGALTVGTLVIFLSYLAALYAPLLTFAYLSGTIAHAVGGARRVLEIQTATEVVEDTPGARALPVIGRHHGSRVTFEHVAFAYRAGTPVLQGIDLEIKPGERVAILGATGAGKTTLVSLIPRLLDPTAGRILIDGEDVRTATLASVRARVSMVLQDPFILPISIAENIRYARASASMEEIRNAARAANAEEFISRLPQGFDTVVSERGATLSGGQRQRLAIARALLKNAPILVLDEPTSALDSETETRVMDAIERVMLGRTTFVIAHRLSTIAGADRIVVLDRGVVRETGTHSELLNAGGLFAQLWHTSSAIATARTS